MLLYGLGIFGWLLMFVFKRLRPLFIHEFAGPSTATQFKAS